MRRINNRVGVRAHKFSIQTSSAVAIKNTPPFFILGLIPKESFADAPQPETKPDQILIERKQKEALRQKELEEARTTTDSNKFEPRSIRSVDSL